MIIINLLTHWIVDTVVEPSEAKMNWVHLMKMLQTQTHFLQLCHTARV